jgi:hypothetical protein
VVPVGVKQITPGDISLSLMDDFDRMVRRQLQPA